MTKQRRLGKGLNSLIPMAEVDNGTMIEEIPLDSIEPNPFQPRRHFDQERLEELAASIKVHGILEPIIVRKAGKNYEIVVGERRWRASKICEMATIPAVVRDWDDRQMTQVALIENLQRENLNVIEEAEGYRRLIEEFSLTQEEVADSVGKKRSSIANTLRLLGLDSKVKKMVFDGELSAGHAKVLLSVENTKLRQRLAERVVREMLSVRQLEQLLKSRGSVPRGTQRETDAEIVSLQDELQQHFGTKVKIDYKKGKGKIEILYFSDDEFERILEMFREERSL